MYRTSYVVVVIVELDLPQLNTYISIKENSTMLNVNSFVREK